MKIQPLPRWLLLTSIWILAVIACIPAIWHWQAPKPAEGAAEIFLLVLGYLAGAGICYAIFRAECRRLEPRQAFAVMFLVFVVTAITNNLHHINVDKGHYFKVTDYPSNTEWQDGMNNDVVDLKPAAAPHSYRFLPNSIARWFQMSGMSYAGARDIYRLIFCLLLFYAIYRFASLYCNFTGSLIAVLLAAATYPVSYEYYAGQLTDPIAHLSFVLAFIFLELDDFAWLATTILIGSLAKETILAMTGFYFLWNWKRRETWFQSIALGAASIVAYFGPRFYVLHGTMGYEQVSGVTISHLQENITDQGKWIVPFLLTACALLPFLILAWKETPLILKRLVIFLLPVLFISGLFFSWLRESRNFMPLAIVLAVVAGRFVTEAARRSTVKLDQWAWAARFYKNRSLALEACQSGVIQLNGRAAKPGDEVRVGDVLLIRKEGSAAEIEVLKLSSVRGPVSESQSLYRETASPDSLP